MVMVVSVCGLCVLFVCAKKWGFFFVPPKITTKSVYGMLLLFLGGGKWYTTRAYQKGGNDPF
jgi:hypothetical protein